MHTKADVQTHVHTYQQQRGVSLRALARHTGIDESALRRMLELGSPYRGDRANWVRLAQYVPLGASKYHSCRVGRSPGAIIMRASWARASASATAS